MTYANPLGGDVWFHGTTATPDDLKSGFVDPMYNCMESYEGNDQEPDGSWNAVLGTHFAAHHGTADGFANDWYDHDTDGCFLDADSGRYDSDLDFRGVVHARLGLQNPKVYRSEFDLDSDAYAFAYAAGNHPQDHLAEYLDGSDGREALDELWGNTYDLIQRYGDQEIPEGKQHPDQPGNNGWPLRTLWMNSHPARWQIAEQFREHLITQGYDGIVYVNEYERDGRRGVEGACVIVFDSAAIEISAHHHADDEPCDWTPAPWDQWAPPWSGERHATSGDPAPAAWVPGELVGGDSPYRSALAVAEVMTARIITVADATDTLEAALTRYGFDRDRLVMGAVQGLHGVTQQMMTHLQELRAALDAHQAGADYHGQSNDANEGAFR